MSFIVIATTGPILVKLLLHSFKIGLHHKVKHSHFVEVAGTGYICPIWQCSNMINTLSHHSLKSSVLSFLKMQRNEIVG